MKEYNGHRSWNAWNVALWLSNEYNLYQEIVDRVRKNGLTKAVNMMYRDIGGYKTPDGAIYNKLSIKLAIEGMAEDMDIPDVMKRDRTMIENIKGFYTISPRHTRKSHGMRCR